MSEAGLFEWRRLAGRAVKDPSWESRPPVDSPPATRPLGALDAAIVLGALWLATRPYHGVIHDARLYALQGLAHLDPGRYGGDLFFRFGSQDDFSVFGLIVSPVLARFGTEATTLLFTLCGEGLWLVGAGMLASALFARPPERAIALGAIIALPSVYGGSGIFHYAEPFFTPRLFAEALILMAIAAALRRRWVACTALAAAAVAVHPLMAAPGVLLILGLLALEDRRWWLVPLAGAAAAVGLACLGVEPFARLREVLAGDWLQIALHRCRWAFLGGWSGWDYLRLAVQIEIVLVALRRASALERRLLAALAVTVAAGLAATAIGADFLHNLLVVNVQPTRVLWLASVVVNLLAGVTLLRLYAAGSAVRWHYAAGTLIYLLSGFLDWFLAPALLALAVAVALPWPRTARWRAAPLVGLAATASASGTALGIAAMILVYLVGFPDGTWFCLSAGTIALALAAGASLCSGRPWIALPLAVLAGAVVVSAVDRRTGWERFTQQARPAPELAALLGNARNVYWEGGVELLWFRLRRPSYYSCLQGTGTMFYRQTALEYERRGRVLATLNTADFAAGSGNICAPKSDVKAVASRSPQALVAACAALPDLDLMVLMSKVDDLATASWEAPAPQYRLLPDGSYQAVTRYYVYDCRKLRLRR